MNTSQSAAESVRYEVDCADLWLVAARQTIPSGNVAMLEMQLERAVHLLDEALARLGSFR